MASPSKKDLKKYTLDEIKEHNKSNDCWIILFGKVVNVTSYLAEHPGGMEILIKNSSAQDATAQFLKKGHTDYARSIMEQYVIGQVDEEGLAKLEKEKAAANVVSANKDEVYSMEEVKKHNHKNDCWVVVDNVVYNVTYFLKDHPGGPEAVIRYAGKDATKAFNDQESHDSAARRQLADMAIGTLAGGKSTNSTKDSGKSSSGATSNKLASGGKLISWLELSSHRSETDCWVAVEGKVYDVTDYLQKHPGGAQIMLNASGRDATKEFVDQGHTQNAREIMKKRYIGEIDKDSEKVQVGSQDMGIKPHQIVFLLIGIAFGVLMYYLLR